VSRAARRAVIAEGLKTLKMPSVLRDYEQKARQAQDAQWDYEDYLWQLLETEIRDREARFGISLSIRIRLPSRIQRAESCAFRTASKSSVGLETIWRPARRRRPIISPRQLASAVL